MKASYAVALGGPEQIRFGSLPDPVPASNQVLVRVGAVAVDSVDALVLSGAWPTEVDFPLVLGRDLVGTVVRTAAGFAAGDRVWTNSAGYGGRPGATAELVAVETDRLYPLPAGADPTAFVAAVHPGATAYGVLVDRVRLRAGEVVGVIGASGAVGGSLVQVAELVGARVLAVVRDDRVASRLRELGAAEVLVADAADAPAVLEAAGGVDVLVDPSGRGPVAELVQRALRPRGRMVVVAGRTTAELDVWRFYLGERQLLGFVMSAMTGPELAAAASWLNEHPLRVQVGEVLGFADRAVAHRRIAAGELPRMPDGSPGRIVLVPGSR